MKHETVSCDLVSRIFSRQVHQAVCENVDVIAYPARTDMLLAFIVVGAVILKESNCETYMEKGMNRTVRNSLMMKDGRLK